MKIEHCRRLYGPRPHAWLKTLWLKKWCPGHE